MNSVCSALTLARLVRLPLYKQCTIPLILNTINNKNYISSSQMRSYSVKSSVESTVKSQEGIFQTISESAPVEYLQKLLVTIHDQSGLPWWATIIATTILLRSCITVPFAIYQQTIMARVENISAEMPAIAKELQREMALAVKMFKWDEKTAKYQYRRSIKMQWNKLIVRDNCHPFKASILLWFQIPLWISYSMSLRNLVYMLPKPDLDAQIIYAELTLGGFGWIPNLTEIDHSYILPITLGIVNLANIELQALLKTKPPTKFHIYITHFFRGLSVLMVPLAACVPSCLALYWTTSSVYGLVQNLVLVSPRVKRFCRIPTTPSELENPYEHIANSFKNKYLDKIKLK